ncbi:hypothetical protein GTA08_BOTSDO01456 [Neofusicoccum parvum]|uniref:Uncharacterized protein n=1 Tax=Neofusicoccum parvum TaxID=310453 RepID=A0ACB5SQ81_9PEZI|nr:hypothetical protein GTA08_BOTSDO01456 [Neofusicoccum parvum]
MRSYYSRLDVSPVDADEPQQCAKQAWKLCTTVAQRAKERFQHAYFTRYVSLCFFLIWESFSTKTGKAGARELNVKMKEAGFEGTSRTLKSLRDETIFINRLLASVRRMYGDEVVSKLMYCVFDSANYRFVRSINRFGEGKKLSAVEYIRNKIGSAPSMEAHFPVIQVQDILKEYLPSLRCDCPPSSIRIHEC